MKKRDKTTQQVELMVCLRPKVLRTPEDAHELLKRLDKQIPEMKKWQDDVPAQN